MKRTGKYILVILAMAMMIPGAAWCCCSFSGGDNSAASNDQACCGSESQSHNSDPFDPFNPTDSDCPDSPSSDQPGGCPVRISIAATVPLQMNIDRDASTGAFVFNLVPCLSGQQGLFDLESKYKLAYLYEHPPENGRCRSLLSLRCLLTT